jgi:hypothetical protein
MGANWRQAGTLMLREWELIDANGERGWELIRAK